MFIFIDKWQPGPFDRSPKITVVFVAALYYLVSFLPGSATGALLALYGYRIFELILQIIGFIIGCSIGVPIGVAIGAAISSHDNALGMVILMAIVMGILLGGICAALAKTAYRFLIFVYGGIHGALLFFILIFAITSNIGAVHILAGLIGFVIGGYFAIKMNVLMIMFGSSFFGCILISISHVLPAASLFNRSGQLDLISLFANISFWWYPYIIILIVIGFIFQRNQLRIRGK